MLSPSTWEAETKALKCKVRPNQVLGLLISSRLFPSWPLLCWDFSLSLVVPRTLLVKSLPSLSHLLPASQCPAHPWYLCPRTWCSAGLSQAQMNRPGEFMQLGCDPMLGCVLLAPEWG